MNKYKYLLPAAIIAAGFWACGDENTTATECTTEQCLIDKYGEFNADSANLANQQTPVETIDFEINEGPNVIDVPADSSGATSQEPGTTPQDSNQTGNPVDVQNDSIPNNSYTSSSSLASEPVVGSSSSGHHHHTSSSSVGDVKPAESSSSEEEVIPPTPGNDFVEDHRSECQIGNIPTSVNNAKLPDPFMGLDGKRISSKADWKCRREEIGAMYEKLMFGEKPRNPEKVEGKKSGNKYTVTVTDKGKSVSFDVTINSAGTKDKPKPALIGLDQGFGSCGSLGSSTNGLDIAMITFNTNNVAPESGGGKFFQLYNGGQGTIIAWAWGVSRLIDALEKDPDAGIDVKHLAVSGCSRLGKAALAIGAFDERIALTIPQESGSGGASLWRVGAQVNKQKGKQFVQGLASAGSEGKWMISSFKNYDGRENTLPFDQHMLVSMVAPRPLLIIDNAGQEWLGEVPSNYCGQASLETYKALGVTENYTYSQEGGHAHCSLPNGQFDEVKDFMNKFLLGKDAKTGKIDYSKNTQTINFKKSEWIDWETPTLN
ncbi:hypothetical protein B7988_01915 [Fibrobacter sp. UWB1]|uniref:glucuronyl esterase domain-containing protein n=1 Tax=Fibrobacter sp. UWB1 TaxID=1964355 RepID=UPI000B5219ED|nr:hypothetical protein [Fibrobacter sp. UWB1]OWV26949.1 hypothetical protein B7988_01915 [Fibrobacter sp. UWB1]